MVNPITVGNFAFPFNCSHGGWDLRLYDVSDLKTYLYITGLWPYVVSVVRPTGVKLLDFFFLVFSVMYC